jgi:hypothetical protein
LNAVRSAQRHPTRDLFGGRLDFAGNFLPARSAKISPRRQYQPVMLWRLEIQ